MFMTTEHLIGLVCFEDQSDLFTQLGFDFQYEHQQQIVIILEIFL